MIDELLVDTVTFYRDTDDLFKNSSIPVSVTIDATYRTPVIVEFEVPAGTSASFQILGVSGGVGKTENIVFNGTATFKSSVSSYTGLSTISTLTGSTSSVTARLRNQSGQPYYMENIIADSIPARISKNEEGSFTRSLTLRNSSVQVQDNHLCFITYGYNLIKAKDRMLHHDSNDRYMVLAVDEVRDFSDYHHTEITIGLIEPSLKE